MDKAKVKVIDVAIGKYDCDSITVELDGVKTEICFDKKDSVSQFLGKEIYITEDKGKFSITSVEVIKK